MARGGYRENAGRKKAIHTIQSEAAKALLVKIAHEKMEPVAKALVEKASKGDVPAIKELFDRVFGKAPQAMELTGKDGEKLFKPSTDIEKLALLLNDAHSGKGVHGRRGNTSNKSVPVPVDTAK